MKIATPTIHLNGSHGPTLLEGYLEAHTKATELLDALQAIEFNARDYYPQGPAAFEAARTEYEARFKAALSIRRDLDAIILAIQEQQ